MKYWVWVKSYNQHHLPLTVYVIIEQLVVSFGAPWRALLKSWPLLGPVTLRLQYFWLPVLYNGIMLSKKYLKFWHSLQWNHCLLYLNEALENRSFEILSHRSGWPRCKQERFRTGFKVQDRSKQTAEPIVVSNTANRRYNTKSAVLMSRHYQVLSLKLVLIK